MGNSGDYMNNEKIKLVGKYQIDNWTKSVICRFLTYGAGYEIFSEPNELDKYLISGEVEIAFCNEDRRIFEYDNRYLDCIYIDELCIYIYTFPTRSKNEC